LATKLASLGVPHQIVTGTGGHKVTTTPATLTAIYDFFKTHAHSAPNAPADTLVGNHDATAQKLVLTLGANGNGASVRYAIHTDATPRQWVQADGTVGAAPAWRTLAEWGSPVRVGPLANPATAKFTVVAYDPILFTTAQNAVNVAAPAAPLVIGNLGADPVTGAISFTWPAPAGVLYADSVPRTAAAAGWS